MINFLLAVLVYLSFVILIFVLKINKKADKKTKIRTVVIPVCAFFLQLLIEWIFYMVLFVFGDDKSIYISGSMIINAIEILIPFLTVAIVGWLNGCSKKIGIIALISILFVILSFVMKYIYSDYVFKMSDEITNLLYENPDSISYLDSLTKAEDLDWFYKVVLVLNVGPALLLEIYMIVKAKGKKN